MKDDIAGEKIIQQYKGILEFFMDNDLISDAELRYKRFIKFIKDSKDSIELSKKVAHLNADKRNLF